MSATISTITRRFSGTLAGTALDEAAAAPATACWSHATVAAVANETLPRRRYVHERHRTPADARREAERAMRWRD